MTVVSRRTRAPSRPFTHGERNALVVVALSVYILAVALIADHTPHRVAAALQTKIWFSKDGWTQVWFIFAAVGYFPFTALFLRAAHRLLSPLLRLEQEPLEVEESAAPLAAWASSTLDKKRKP